MTMGRFGRLNLPLMIGVSLFIPLLPGYSLYVDLSGPVLLSSDMSFEDPEDEDLSACQDEFTILVCIVSSYPLPSGCYLGSRSSLFLSLLRSHTQNRLVLRC
jgi:hypothetical protein